MSDPTNPQPEALGASEGYGLEGLGPKHMPLTQVMTRFGAERSWWVATTRPDGRPHVTPVWGVYLDNMLLFSCGPASVKGMNLAANPQIALHLESGDQVAIIEGTAVAMAGNELPSEFVGDYEDKYGFEVDITDPGFQFYRVAPTKMFSWDEGDFTNTAARWRWES